MVGYFKSRPVIPRRDLKSRPVIPAGDLKSRPVIPAGDLCLLYPLLFIVSYLAPAGANLEYEFTATATVVVLFALPFAAIFWRFDDKPAWFFALAFILFQLFGELLFLSGTCQCSGQGYRFWLAFNLLPTWIFAHALASWFSKQKQVWSRWRLFKIYLLMASALTLSTVATLWFLPQKRLTSFFLGHWHGPVYDEWIPLDHAMLIARFLHLIVAVIFYGLVKHSAKKAVWFLGSSLVLLEVLLYPTLPGLAHGRFALDKALSAHKEGSGYVLSYDASLDKQAISLFEEELQFHLADLSLSLGSSLPLVSVYVYKDEDQKKIFFGGGSTDLTDVVTPSLHVTLEDWPHPSLRHELVHALTAKEAFFGLGFHPNMAFTEGLAVALETAPTLFSLHEAAAYILNEQKAMEVDALLSPMFWLESGREAYTVAGSLILYLKERYGLAKVLALYHGNGVEAALGVSGEALKRQYLEFLQDKKNPQAKLYFGSRFQNQGVFARACPHTNADFGNDEKTVPPLAWRRPFGFAVKRDYWPWRLALEAPSLALQFAHLQAKIRNKAPLVEVFRDVDSALEQSEQSLGRLQLELLKSDLLYGNDPETSGYYLDEILAREPDQILPYPFKRSVLVRAMIDVTVVNDKAKAWRSYVAGLNEKPVLDLSSDTEFILHYLELLALVNKKQFSKVPPEWVDAMLPEDTHALIQKNWHWNLVQVCLALGKSEVAKKQLSFVQQFAESGEAQYFSMLSRFLSFAENAKR